MIDKFIRLVANISRICGISAAILIFLSVLIVCQMVVIRYVLQESVIWQTEFVTYSLIAATLIGSPYVLLTKGHVNVDLVPLYISYKARFYLALFASTASLIFCLLVAWLGYEFWLEAWDNNWVSDSIWEVRLWIPYAALPFGFAVISLQYVADIISLVTGRDLPFGITDQDAAELEE